MVSKVGSGNPGFELPGQVDRAELGYRELGTWLNALPPSLQDALHRVFRAGRGPIV